ncbi:hypothetical protein F4678DRAFT_485279 [Xylaria arbuscula]|nr:hypothetical protein F4678DRAFT_485279 [Xylaria arbuscula]
MATLKQQKDLGREVAQHFTQNPAIEFVGFAGVGRHGGALILAEKNEQGELQRKMVVKYSLGKLTGDPKSNADEDLRNEFYWLERLRGAEHIVRLVPFADCTLKLPGISDGEKTYEDSKGKGKERDDALRKQVKGGDDKSGRKVASSRARKCPTFALEYLPNGQVSDTIEKIKRDKDMIPNRILWRVWLCCRLVYFLISNTPAFRAYSSQTNLHRAAVVRQCVAMAYPPCLPFDGVDDGRSIREQIIPDQQCWTLTQNSPHLENWLWGSEPSPGAPDTDHDPGIPLVKLIDFGRGKLEDLKDYVNHDMDDLQQCGSRVNLYHAALVMMEICRPFYDFSDFEPDDIYMYTFVKDGQTRDILTFAPFQLRKAVSMDPQLRDILVRCMSEVYGDVPPLNEVLEEAEAAVASKGPDSDPELADLMRVREHDNYLRGWIQRYIYDAPWEEVFAIT